MAVGGKLSGLLFDPVLHGFGAVPHLINVPVDSSAPLPRRRGPSREAIRPCRVPADKSVQPPAAAPRSLSASLAGGPALVSADCRHLDAA